MRCRLCNHVIDEHEATGTFRDQIKRAAADAVPWRMPFYPDNGNDNEWTWYPLYGWMNANGNYATNIEAALLDRLRAGLTQDPPGDMSCVLDLLRRMS